jgi:hypothetical protein
MRGWIGVAVFLAFVGIAAWLVPRVGARSPVAILVLCTLAVLTMKLVERRVQAWFRRWAARQAARASRQ